jgi:DNA-binding transcriptional MerR regulator
MPEEETPVSISEASHILGVSEAALRQWTDGGRIKAFITPGGHRRYAPSELKKFSGAHTRTLGVKDLVVELEETIDQHREIGRAHLEKAPWYGDLSRRSREKLADMGRSLLQLIIKYISEPARRKETLEQAREVGASLGRLCADLQFPLTDSVEAFLLHSDPIVSAATHLMKKRESHTGRIIGVIPMIGQVMDEALLALVAAHQQVRNGARDREEAGHD